MPSSLFLVLVGFVQTASPGPKRVDYAVVVHADNPVQSLSSARLRRILRAEVQQWPSRRSIELLLPRSGTDSKRVLLERVYDMTDLQLKQYWTGLIYRNRIVEAPRAVPSSAVALRMLERTRGSITIVPVAEVPDDVDVKVLTIDDCKPGEAGYPLFELKRGIAAGEKSAKDDPVIPSKAGAPQMSADPVDAVFKERAPLTLTPTTRTEQDELTARIEALEEQMDVDSIDRGGPPRFHIRGFAHAEVEYERQTTSSGTESDSAFSIEVLDLLITSALSDRFSMLAETVIEAQDDGAFDVEIERLLLKYRYSDALILQMGRFLTSIGHWNTRYHHGEWLQTSIDRPEVLDFEDDGGLLPIHSVGLSLGGGVYGDSLSVDYAVEVANGRGPTPDVTQNKLDDNDLKAVNVSLGLEPGFLPGLRIGGGVYLDDIPDNGDAAAGPLHGEIEEQINSVYIAYASMDWEVVAEYFTIEHDDGAVTADSSGWYAQLERHFGRWTPYVRVDGIERSDADTFFEPGGDAMTTALGTRCDVAQWAALTLQYEHADVDAFPGGEDEKTRTLVLQASFTF